MSETEKTMKVSINMNEEVEVTLSDKGIKILEEAQQTFLLKGNKRKLRTQLWCLMSIFGKSMYNGCTIPFEDNLIHITKN